MRSLQVVSTVPGDPPGAAAVAGRLALAVWEPEALSVRR